MAATSEDVMRAVLALDAYNQGYSPGMTRPKEALLEYLKPVRAASTLEARRERRAP
jgi:hypothetical protein